MRIVAGQYRSRQLITLKGDNTRPTLDKVREAVFSRIGPYFETEKVLDLFSGSGAIGFEALSRGACFAVMNDKSAAAVAVIRKNAEALGCTDRCRITNADYRTLLERLSQDQMKFDIVYLDPPYKLEAISGILKMLLERELLENDAIIVAETLKQEQIEIPEPLELEKEAFYGITKITYIRYKGEEL